MVLINELTVEQINAALLHLQRSKDEVVGGEKGTTIQNITISNSGGGGGNNVDYSGTIKNLANLIDKNTSAIGKNTSDIAKLKSDFSNIEKSVEDTLQGLVDNGISDLSFDPLTKQLTITTNDGDIYQTTIEQDISYLSYDSATNKLILTTGNQSQEITLPYIKASEKGSANGVATLDENGRVPYSQLPESAMEFLGQWNASTNTPHLADGTGTNGDFYIVSAGGTVNLGTAQDPHIITFSVNDRIVYEGDIAQWVRLPAGQVSSVNGQSGEVTLTASDIEYSTGISIKDKIDANAVQSDWNVSDTTSLAYIKNKPTIPASPVQSDWNVTDTTSLAYIKNKPTIPSNTVGIENKGNNAWYPVAICTGTSCVGRSTGYGFSYNPGTGYLSPYSLSLGRGCCIESAGIIQAQGTCNTYSMICFLNNTSDVYGNGVSIGGGGIVIVGAGESAGTVWSGVNGTSNLYGSHAGDETLYLASDNAIYLMANVQSGYTCRKTASLSTVTENNVVYGLFTADRFCGNLCGNSTSATTATWVKGNTMRPANSNLYPKSANGSLTHFLATSSMTTGKPSADGHIVQMSWDNAGGYGAQLFLGNSANIVPQYRAENGGTWTSWHNFITDENISSQHVACADHATSADVVHASSADAVYYSALLDTSDKSYPLVFSSSNVACGYVSLKGNINAYFCCCYTCPTKSHFHFHEQIAPMWRLLATPTFTCNQGADTGTNWYLSCACIDDVHQRGQVEVWNCTNFAHGKNKIFSITLQNQLCPIKSAIFTYMCDSCGNYGGPELSAFVVGTCKICFGVFNRNSGANLCRPHFLLQWWY